MYDFFYAVIFVCGTFVKEFFNNHRKLFVWLFVIFYPLMICAARIYLVRIFFAGDCDLLEIDMGLGLIVYLAVCFLPACAAFFWLSEGEKGDRFLLALTVSIPYLVIMIPGVGFLNFALSWGGGMAAKCGWVLP